MLGERARAVWAMRRGLGSALLAAVDADAASGVSEPVDLRPNDHASPGMVPHDLPLGA